jgi:transcription antitermination factor NusG
MLFQFQETQGKDGSFPWFAVRVRSNREQLVALHLRDRGVEEYAPSYEVTTQWTDRKKTSNKFLFPGYVFCRLDTSNRLPVLSIPGVVGLVGCGKTPVPIPEFEIDRVRAMVNSGLPLVPWPYLDTGDTVFIERGPLAGVEGILQSTKGVHRIVISFSLLQRSVSAEIDRAWVRPLKKNMAIDNREELLVRAV